MKRKLPMRKPLVVFKVKNDVGLDQGCSHAGGETQSEFEIF